MKSLTKFDVLNAWLDRVGARLLWQMSSKGRTGYDRMNTAPFLLHCVEINGRVVIIQEWTGNGTGWQIYVPSSDKNDTAACVDGAAAALGVDGCRGLVEEAVQPQKA